MSNKHSAKHKGVTLTPPNPTRRTGWVARWTDPDTRRQVGQTLPTEDARTTESRTAWAVRKAGEIARRKIELDDGAPRATGTPVAKGIAQYYEASARHLRAGTQRTYRLATDKLARWAATAGVRTLDDLTRAKLMALRAALLNEPKREAVPGGRKGEKAPGEKAKSAASVNRDLASLRAVTGYLYDAGLLPKVREGDLRRAFKKERAAVERIEFLDRDELRQLFEAARAHDSATFSETRAEHARGAKGATPKFEPVTPMIAIVLLSGMRLGEAITLDWRQVDLAAGEIHLTGATKTKRARTIDLEVSPALRAILGRLHEAAGGEGRVIRFSGDAAKNAMMRLRSDFGAPAKFTWQVLRRTCGTFLTNAPGIFGGASAYRSAKQLGHSVKVAEDFYLGLVRGIPATAKTVEAAMAVEDLLARVLA